MKRILYLGIICSLFTIACSTRSTVISDQSTTNRRDTKSDSTKVITQIEPQGKDSVVRAKNNENLSSLRSLGDSLYQNEKYEEAFPVWLKILDHSGKDKQTSAAAHYVLGTIFYHKEEYTKAEIEFKYAIKDDSTFIDPYREIGLVYIVKGDYDKAIMSFERILHFAPNDSEATSLVGYAKGSQAYEKGLTDFNEEYYDEAIRHFKTAAKYLADDTSANYKIYFFLGKSYLEKLDYERALPALNKAITLNPSLHEGYTEIGTVYFARRDFKQAIASNLKALELLPTYAKGINNLGYVYFTQGNEAAVKGDKKGAVELYQKSISLFEKALTTDPGLDGARKNLDHVRKILSGSRNVRAFTMLQAANKTESASDKIKQLKNVISQDSTYDDAYNNLGVALYYDGQVDDGIAMVERAIAINGFNPQARNNLGFMLSTAHRFEEGIKQLFIAIQIKRDYFDAYINLGYAYMWKNDFTSSRKIWLQLLKLNPGNIMARKGLEEMEKREKQLNSGETTITIEYSDDPDEGNN